MTPKSDGSTITAMINTLYEEASVGLPTVHRCIAPLNALIEGSNLICKEVQGLNGYAAMTYLLQHGAVNRLTGNETTEPLAGFFYANSHFGSIFVEQNDIIRVMRIVLRLAGPER